MVLFAPLLCIQGGPGSRALPPRETFRDRGEIVVGKPLSRSHGFPDFNVSNPTSYIPEEVRHPCAFHIVKIVVNAQIYMGAWVWNVKNDVKAHTCRTFSGYIRVMHSTCRN